MLPPIIPRHTGQRYTRTDFFTLAAGLAGLITATSLSYMLLDLRWESILFRNFFDGCVRPMRTNGIGYCAYHNKAVGQVLMEDTVSIVHIVAYER